MANLGEKGVGLFSVTRINLATGSVNVTTAPSSNGKGALLQGVYINTAPSVDIYLKDGSTTRYVIPASSPAGSRLNFPNTRFTQIVVTPSTTATGNISVEYDEY